MVLDGVNLTSGDPVNSVSVGDIKELDVLVGCELLVTKESLVLLGSVVSELVNAKSVGDVVSGVVHVNLGEVLLELLASELELLFGSV